MTHALAVACVALLVLSPEMNAGVVKSKSAWNLRHTEHVVEETREDHVEKKTEAQMENAEDEEEADEIMGTADEEEEEEEAEAKTDDHPVALEQNVMKIMQALPMKLSCSTKEAIEHSISMNLTVNGQQWAFLHKKLRTGNNGKPIRIGVVGGSTTAGGTNPRGGLKQTDPLWFVFLSFPRHLASFLFFTSPFQVHCFRTMVGEDLQSEDASF
jgi:hypothetical protein